MRRLCLLLFLLPVAALVTACGSGGDTVRSPTAEPPTPDELLWLAFSGNALLEEVLRRQAGRVPLAFCGHTHWAREAEFHGVRGFNVGGDYHFKRLLRLDWPAGTVAATEFGTDS